MPNVNTTPILRLVICTTVVVAALALPSANGGEADQSVSKEKDLTAKLAELIRTSQKQLDSGEYAKALTTLTDARRLALLNNRREVKQIEARIKRVNDAQAAAASRASKDKPQAEVADAPKADETVEDKHSGIMLTMRECEEIAIQNNLSLRIARLNDRAADLDLRVAWSRYFPRFNLGLTHSGGRGSESHFSNNTLSGSITQRAPWGSTLTLSARESEDHPGFTPTRKSSEWGASLNQPLWKGAGLDVGLHDIRTARLSKLISRGNLELDVQDLIFSVRSSYIDCVRQLQTMQVNERAVASSQRFLELTIARERAGQVTKLDVFNAEVQKGNREETLLRNNTALENALDSLKQTMDVDLEENLRVEDHPVDFGEQEGPGEEKTIETDATSGAVLLVTRRGGEPQGKPRVMFLAERHDPKVVLQESLSNRIEMLNSRRRLAVRKLNTLLQKDGLGHQVDLSASYSRSDKGSNWTQSHGYEDHNYSVGVNVSIPWGKVTDRAAYERALLDLQTSEISLKQSRTRVHAEVRSILRSLREAEKSILIQAKTVEQAKRSVEAARISFERGLKDSFDVIRAEDDLLEAKTRFINRRLEYAVRIYQLEIVVGKPTGRVDLSGQTPGGMIGSRLPETLGQKNLPTPAPTATPSPEDDPFEYRKKK